MEPVLDIDLILYFLLALMVAFLIALVVVYYLVTRWRKQVDEALLQIGSDLNNAGLQIEMLQGVKQEYSALHRQPYTDLSDELQKKINRVLQDAQSLEQRWLDLNTLHHQVPLSRLQALIDLVPNAYHNQKTASSMWQHRDRIQRQLGEAQALAKRMEALPSEMYSQTLRAGEGIQKMESMLKDLHEAGLHGKQVEEADDALLRMQQGWRRIPAEFIAGQPPDVQLGAVRETTSAVFTVLGDIQPLLDEWLERVTGWDAQYRRAVESYERLRKTATNFRSALNNTASGLIVDGFRTELDKVGNTARALNRRLQEPLIEDLKALERETAHLDKVVQDSAARYDAASRRVEQLDRTLLELDTQLKVEAGRLEEAEKLQVHPLQWDISRPALNEIEESIAALGTREQPRTPEQVEEASKKAGELAEKLNAYTKRVDLVLERHRELLALLGTGAIANGAAFAAQVQTLAHNIQAYDPANWSSQESVSSLPAEAAQLDELQRQLTAGAQPAPIAESRLSDRLEEARRLAELHTRLRDKVDRVAARFADLQKVESDALDDVERAATTVESLALLLKDNPSLHEIASADLTRYRTELARLSSDLENPAQGAVERKVSRAHTLLDQLARSANGWLDKLAANLQAHTRRLSDLLADLDQVAMLEDRAVIDGRAQLERLGPNPVNRKAGLNFLDAAAELKRWNNDWQTGASVVEALENLAGPVLDAAQDAAQARAATRAAFQAAGKLASGRRDWPPTRQSLAEDVKAFQELERRLDGLRIKRMTSGALVRELGQVYHELDQIEDRVSSAARQAEIEQQEALQIERQVEELQQRWQALAQRYPGQADLDLEIKDLVAQADQRIAQLKAQYKRGGINYDQVISALREQVNTLRTARFTGGEGQDVSLAKS